MTLTQQLDGGLRVPRFKNATMNCPNNPVGINENVESCVAATKGGRKRERFRMLVAEISNFPHRRVCPPILDFSKNKRLRFIFINDIFTHIIHVVKL